MLRLLLLPLLLLLLLLLLLPLLLLLLLLAVLLVLVAPAPVFFSGFLNPLRHRHYGCNTDCSRVPCHQKPAPEATSLVVGIHSFKWYMPLTSCSQICFPVFSSVIRPPS